VWKEHLEALGSQLEGRTHTGRSVERMEGGVGHHDQSLTFRDAAVSQLLLEDRDQLGQRHRM
jgi:hypothetical protein